MRNWRTDLGERCEKPFVIEVVAEDRLTSVTAVHDMVDRAKNFDAVMRNARGMTRSWFRPKSVSILRTDPFPSITHRLFRSPTFGSVEAALPRLGPVLVLNQSLSKNRVALFRHSRGLFLFRSRIRIGDFSATTQQKNRKSLHSESFLSLAHG